LFWTILAFLAAAVLMVGCQIPQVPDYTATPPPAAMRIAYLDGDDLNLMEADGSHSILLARNLQPTGCAPYYVSPNGHQVAYQQADGGLLVNSTDGGQPFAGSPIAAA
jgi:hypothetical protein